MSIRATFIGDLDTIEQRDGVLLSTNDLLQRSAAKASDLAGIFPAAGPTAATITAAALDSAWQEYKNSYATPNLPFVKVLDNSAAIVADTLLLIGDYAVQVPGGKPLAEAVDVAGNVLTAATFLPDTTDNIGTAIGKAVESQAVANAESAIVQIADAASGLRRQDVLSLEAALNQTVPALQEESQDGAGPAATALAQQIAASYNSVTPLLSSLFDSPGVSAANVTETEKPDSLVVSTDGSPITETTPLGGTLGPSTDLEDGNGGSTILVVGPDGSTTTTVFTGPHGSGQAVSKDVENADGTSALTTYDGTGNSETISYSGPGGTGTAGDISATIGQDVVTLSAIHFDPAREEGDTDFKNTTIEATDGSVLYFSPISDAVFLYGTKFGPYYQGIFNNTDTYQYAGFSDDVYATEKHFVKSGSLADNLVLPIQTQSGSGLITIPVSGTIYAGAIPSQPITDVNLGTIHVGGTASYNLDVDNIATGDLTDDLDGGTLYYYPTSTADQADPFTASSLSGDVAAGASGTVTITGTATQAGSYYGYGSFIFNSVDGALAPEPIEGANTSFELQVNNYAQAALDISVPNGGVTRHGNDYSLNLGVIHVGDDPAVVMISAANSADGPADLLSGTFGISGSTVFDNSGFRDVSDIVAGQDVGVGSISLTPGVSGLFSETLVFSSIGSNTSGYSGALSDIHFTVMGKVVDDGSATFAIDGASYTLPASPAGQHPAAQDYVVEDGGALNVGTSAQLSVQVGSDTGPTLALAIPEKIGHSQTVQVGVVSPGIANDKLNLAVTPDAGSLTLTDGVLNYKAPETGGADSIGYTISDQAGNTVAGTLTVSVDPGPVTSDGKLVVASGQSSTVTNTIGSLIKPGLAGDTDKVTGISAAHGHATLSSTGAILYTAPTTGDDTLTYTVADQLGDTADGRVSVTVDSASSSPPAPSTTGSSGSVPSFISGGGTGTVDLSTYATGGGVFYRANSGDKTINQGRGFASINLGSGNDLVHLGQADATVTMGTGVSRIALGAGHDTIGFGADTISHLGGLLDQILYFVGAGMRSGLDPSKDFIQFGGFGAGAALRLDQSAVVTASGYQIQTYSVVSGAGAELGAFQVAMARGADGVFHQLSAATDYRFG